MPRTRSIGCRESDRGVCSFQGIILCRIRSPCRVRLEPAAAVVSRMKLSIIIPVYNEEQTIGEVVERVRAVDIGAIDKEIIIANDGSSDGTRLAIDSSRWADDPRIRKYHSEINIGKGAAVRLGLKF